MTVELLGHLGDDLAICNAARVSYGKQSTWGCGDQSPAMHGAGCLKPADAGLIGYLARNRHGTPFEMVTMKFRVKCSIGVAREWFRHRHGSYEEQGDWSFNEVSTRYVEMSPEFFMPEETRRQVGKPGHYTFETMAPDESAQAKQMFSYAYRDAYGKYCALLAVGVAKELARNVLPLGLLTEFIWAVNARSVFNFLSLRTAPSALLEIRQEAELVEQHVARIVPAAYAAWVEGGRLSL